MAQGIGLLSRERGVAMLLAVWSIACAAGFSLLWVHGGTPGDGAVPPNWSDVAIPWASDAAFRMVVAVHPKCPCTRATVTELERILSCSDERLACLVLQYQPVAQEETFGQTDLMDRISRLPRTSVHLDPEGQLAASLHMHTSGAIALYNADGSTAFYGGITCSRGHEGKSLGAEAIQTLLEGGTPIVRSTHVYGCPIQSKSCDLADNAGTCKVEPRL